MKEIMDGLFKFKIGQLVHFRTMTATKPPIPEWPLDRTPLFMVVGRRVNECPGGVQVSYELGWGHTGGALQHINNTVHEIELEAFNQSIKSGQPEVAK